MIVPPPSNTFEFCWFKLTGAIVTFSEAVEVFSGVDKTFSGAIAEVFAAAVEVFAGAAVKIFSVTGKEVFSGAAVKIFSVTGKEVFSGEAVEVFAGELFIFSGITSAEEFAEAVGAAVEIFWESNKTFSDMSCF